MNKHNKLINAIANFIKDSKYSWQLLEEIEQEYLKSIYIFENREKATSIYEKHKDDYHSQEQSFSHDIEEEIQKLIPCFFEESIK